MIQAILKCISLFRKYFQTIAVAIIMMLTAFLFYTHDKLIKTEAELNRTYNNYMVYQDNSENEKRTLQLTIQEFKEANDSLTKEVKTVQKKLKIKDKNLNQVQVQHQEIIHDTTLVIKEADFNITIQPNESTMIKLIKQDTLLTHILDIYNKQYLFIQSNKEYKHKYKNWFSRLMHFDFKKIHSNKYQIKNTNDLIKVTETQIIEINK